MPPAVDVAAGGSNTCAVTTAGETYCWGAQQYGVGMLTPPDTCTISGGGIVLCARTPIQLPNLPLVVEVDASASNACVRTTTGTVWCWGAAWPSTGGTGGRMIYDPELVVDANGAEGISRSNGHSCLRQATGDLWCWGFNEYGQLGTGVADYGSIPAIPATVVSAVAQVGVGGEPHDWVDYGHTCVSLMSDGSLRCWGSNEYGQLGDGTQVDQLGPQPVPGLLDVVQIDGGSRHTCAITGSGRLYCWGSNDYGELGDGSTTLSPLPVSIP